MTRHRNTRDSSAARAVPSIAAGLSLVELLVALALASLVLLAIVQLFSNSHATYRVNVAQTRVQEAGRYATQVLAKEMRMARSTGCGSIAMDEHWSPPRLNVVACSLLANANCSGNHVIGTQRALGYAAAQIISKDKLTDLPPAAQSAVFDRRVRGDVLVSWGIVGDGTYARATDKSSLTDLITLAGINDQLATGRLALITDCTGSDVFSISGITEDKKSLAHSASSGANSANSASALRVAYNWKGAPLSGSPAVRARVFPFDMKVFFIGCVDQEKGSTLTEGETGFDLCVAGTSERYRPALAYWSVSMGQTAVLLMDIADLRTTYDGSIDLGVKESDLLVKQRVRQRMTDAAGKDSVDAAWVTANKYWDQVDSIRIELLAISTDEVAASDRKYTDSYTASTGIGSDLTADRRLYQAVRVTVATRATSDWYLRYDVSK